MIITAAYLRQHYTGAPDTSDTTAQECLRSALSDVQAIIGQPLQASTVTWYFTGDGRDVVTFPYTLKVENIEVAYRDAFGDAWTVIDDAEIEYLRPVIYGKSAFVRDRAYKVTASVGLADTVGPATSSADFSSSHSYEALRAVICEMAEARFYASSKTNTGTKRSGILSASKSAGGTITDSVTLVGRDRLMDDWRKRLRPYCRLRTL